MGMSDSVSLIIPKLVMVSAADYEVRFGDCSSFES